MLTQINTEVDIDIEYKDVVLKFRMVPVTGTVESGPATYWEPSWSEVDIHVGLTKVEVQNWVVELFQYDDLPVPPWACTDGQEILDEMEERIEVSI